MIDIIVDSREPYKSYFVKRLKNLGWDVLIKPLDTADFYILSDKPEDCYLIERKEASDFHASIQGVKDINTGLWTKGKLWSQLQRMVEGCDGNLILLIEKSIYDSRRTSYKKTGMTKTRLWGAEEGVRKWGVGIKHVKDKKETVEYLDFLIRRTKRPKREHPLRASAKPSMSLKDQKKYLLQGLPSVGPKTSNEILKIYKWKVLDALNNVDEWDVIKGIGPTGHKRMKEVLK
jgi:ERCC4-type nuclease